jgi:hypothetical protein
MASLSRAHHQRANEHHDARHDQAAKTQLGTEAMPLRSTGSYFPSLAFATSMTNLTDDVSPKHRAMLRLKAITAASLRREQQFEVSRLPSTPP